MIALLLPGISNKCPMVRKSHIVCLIQLKPVILNLKNESSVYIKKQYPQFHEKEYISSDATFDPLLMLAGRSH
jgi:hypothetical protein